MSPKTENEETFRGVFQSEKFLEELKKISRTIQRGDEFIRGVEWILAKNPRSGFQISEHVWCIPNNPEMPEKIRIFYAFDKKEVYLLSIIKSDHEA